MKRSSIYSPEDFEREYVIPRPGRTLIVGSKVYPGRVDRRQRYADVLGIDMEAGEGVDRVMNLENWLPENIGKFSHIDCLSVLEHSKKPWWIAENVERMLKPKGTLFVGVPFVWRQHSYPSDYWRFTAEGIKLLFPNIEWSQLQFVNASGENRSVPSIHHHGYLYFMKTEVYGFGVRR